MCTIKACLDTSAIIHFLHEDVPEKMADTRWLWMYVFW